nr:MAG TPA: hypothetical protein [Caudoviricetes sp.]
MKNWLIEKLGGVSKKDHEEVIQTANSLKNMADDYSQRISDGLKEKAEIEEAGKEMSDRISELIDKLNEERKVSNGLMAKARHWESRFQSYKTNWSGKTKNWFKRKRNYWTFYETNPIPRYEARLQG